MPPKGAKSSRNVAGALRSAAQATPRRKLEPSEPLHITTRAAASRAASVATQSTAPSAASQSAGSSVASTESRRSSLRDASVNVGGDDIDNERPAKFRRRSLRHSQVEAKSSSEGSQENGHENDHLIVADDDTSGGSQNARDNTDLGADDANTKHDSDGMGASQTDLLGEETPVETTTNLKPRPTPLRRGDRRTRGWRAGHLNAPSTRIPKQSTPLHDLDNDLTDRQSPEKNESGGILDRLPGRRRAPHPDMKIEIALRRQLELKVAYRSVVKVLKPLLAELADRTILELQIDNDLHKAYPEYDLVQKDLDERLAERQALLAARVREEEQRLERIHTAKEDIIRRNFEHIVDDRRERHVLQCQEQFLTTWRDAQLREDENATVLEGGIIPPLYTVVDGERTPLSHEYHARSRPIIELGRLWKDFETRQKVARALHSYDPASVDRAPKNFAVYDGDRRRFAMAHLGIQALLQATKDVERMGQMPAKTIANKDATRLQALAEASSMPLQHHAFVPGPLLSGLSAVGAGPSAVSTSTTPGAYGNAKYKISSEPLRRPVMPPLRQDSPSRTGQISRGQPPPSPASKPQAPPNLGLLAHFGHKPLYGPATHISPYPPVSVAPSGEHVPQEAAPPMHNGFFPPPQHGYRIPPFFGQPPPPGFAPYQPPRRDSIQDFSAMEQMRPLQHQQHHRPPSHHTRNISNSEQITPNRPPTNTKESTALNESNSTSTRPQPTEKPNTHLGPPPNNSGMAGVLVPQPTDQSSGQRRKRPGPRAFYNTHVGQEAAPHLYGGQSWMPFTNSMGPPTFMPKYVKETAATRQASDSSNAGPAAATAGSANASQDIPPHQHELGQQTQPQLHRSSTDESATQRTSITPLAAAVVSKVAAPPLQRNPSNQKDRPEARPPGLSGQIPSSTSTYPDGSTPMPYPRPIGHFSPLWGTPGYPPRPPVPQAVHDFFERQRLRNLPTLPPLQHTAPPQPFQTSPGPPSAHAYFSPSPRLQQVQPQSPGGPAHRTERGRTSSFSSNGQPLAPRRDSLPPADINHQLKQPGQVGHQPILPATLNPARNSAMPPPQQNTAPPPQVATPTPGETRPTGPTPDAHDPRPEHIRHPPMQEWRKHIIMLPMDSKDRRLTSRSMAQPQGAKAGPGPGPGSVAEPAPASGTNAPPTLPPKTLQPFSGPPGSTGDNKGHFPPPHPEPKSFLPPNHPQYQYLFPPHAGPPNPYGTFTQPTNASIHATPSSGIMMSSGRMLTSGGVPPYPPLPPQLPSGAGAPPAAGTATASSARGGRTGVRGRAAADKAGKPKEWKFQSGVKRGGYNYGTRKGTASVSKSVEGGSGSGGGVRRGSATVGTGVAVVESGDAVASATVAAVAETDKDKVVGASEKQEGDGAPRALPISNASASVAASTRSSSRSQAASSSVPSATTKTGEAPAGTSTSAMPQPKAEEKKETSQDTTVTVAQQAKPTATAAVAVEENANIGEGNAGSAAAGDVDIVVSNPPSTLISAGSVKQKSNVTVLAADADSGKDVEAEEKEKENGKKD